MRLIAEAAPNPLLSALEHMLEGTGDIIRPIFDERPGLLFPRSKHTGLLWALETIAWDPSYFRRAVMVLARLAAIDPGGRLLNRPANSLTEIFLLWNPNTNASSAERFAALDEIIQVLPKVGWKLIFSLLPTTHGTSTPTAKPRLREAGAAERKPVTYGELWANNAAVSERAITLAGRSLGRWVELLPRMLSFAPREREIAIVELDKTLSNLEGDSRKTLWEELRAQVIRHEHFAGAPWALPQEELTPLRELTEKYAPADPVTAIVPLFDPLLADLGGDLSEVIRKRSSALLDLYVEHGADAVFQLATEVKAFYPVIEAAYGAGFLPTR